MHSNASACWLLITFILALFYLQFRLTRQANGVARILVLCQIAYVFLGYILRSAVLLVVEPIPGRGDPVADFRLFRLGYDFALSQLLIIVAVGELATTVAIAVFCRLVAPPVTDVGDPPARTIDGGHFVGVWICWAGGLGARALDYAGLDNSIVQLGTIVASSAAAYITIFLLPESKRDSFLIYGMLFSVELTWSVLSESKTPAIAIALSLLIRFARQGWTYRRFLIASLGVVFVVAIFPLLQSVKQSNSTSATLSAVDDRYPVWVSWLGPLLRRFDLLSAVTDAWSARPGNWISLGEYLQRAFTGGIPNILLGYDKPLAGASWAVQVRAQSIPGGSGSVSLAEGPIAEGYVLLGYVGCVVVCLILVLLTLLTARWVCSGTLILQLIAVGFAAQSGLFERGFLGVAEDLSKSVQAALIIGLIAFLCQSRGMKYPRGGSIRVVYRKLEDFAPERQVRT